MSKEQRNVPKLRFSEFTDEWELHEMDDMCSIITKQTGFDYSSTIKPSLITTRMSNTYPFIQNKDFEGENINLNTDFYIPTEIAVKFPKIIIDVPSLLISISGRIGNIGYYNLADKAFIGGAVGICKLSKGDGRFLVYALQSDMGQRYFHSLVKASSHANITVEDIRKIRIYIPKSQKESSQIASFCHAIDTLITLQQHKLDQIKEYKKGMLQKMFPKEGETVPEVRFPRFSGEWVRKRLEDEATEILAGGDVDKSRIIDSGKYPVIANALTGEGIIGYYDDYYRVEAPAVTVTGRGDVGHAQARTFNFTPVVRLLAIRSNHDCYFLENAINNHRVFIESTGVPQLTVPQLSAYIMPFPPTLQEEQFIGTLFRNIDTLITLHQRKLEAMKEYKKGLLQQLFV